MDLGLSARTAILTGASGGLGRSIARRFAAEGADLILAYHRAQAEAEALAKELGDRAHAVAYELGDPDAARSLVADTLERTGRIDVLVNNAVRWGGADPSGDRAFDTVPEAEWTSVIRANVEGAIQLSREVAGVMRRQQWGRLVHLSSTLADDGMPGTEYYAAAKAALHGFSRSVAFSLGAAGDILSNVVMPGLTRTDTNVAIVEAFAEQFSAVTPIGRLLAADEVAGPIVYLGSAANTGITGQVIRVSGGA